MILQFLRVFKLRVQKMGLWRGFPCVLEHISTKKLSILRLFEVNQWPEKTSRFRHKSLLFLHCRHEN